MDEVTRARLSMPWTMVDPHPVEPLRVFPDWQGRFVVTEAEARLAPCYDVPWLWSQVAQAVLMAHLADSYDRTEWPDWTYAEAAPTVRSDGE